MKVCFISLYGYPIFNPRVAGRIGGAEVQLYYMAHGLAADERLVVHFLTGDFGQRCLEMHGGIAVRPFFNPLGRLKYLRSIGGAYRLMTVLRTINPHICIVRAPGFEAGVAALFCLLFNKKLMYMVSQYLEPERKKNYGMHFFRWMMFQFVLRSADLVVSQHEVQQKQLQDYFETKSVIRRNAYPVSHNRIGGVDHKNTVLWVGRCDPWKRPELFIKLARLFPQTPFVMVCSPSGDDGYYTRIKKEADAVRNLQYLPQVSFADTAPYFSAAMIVINTSVSEGFPNTFLQAFDARAAVATLAADPGGIVEAHGLGVCAHDDFEELIKEVRKLLDDRDERVCMGERGYRYLAQHHDIERIRIADRELVFAAAHAKKGKPIIMEFLQYGVGGGVACAVNFLSVFVLTETMGLYYLTSAFISYPLALLTGFLFQAFITFKHKEHLLQKMARFFFHQTIGFGLFIALLYVSTDVFGVYYVVSFFISAGMVYIFNFTCSKVLVFRRRHRSV